MMQYTLAVLAGLGLIFFLDRVLLRTKILRPTPQMGYTTTVFLLFQLVFDNYFTWKEIWVFNPNEIIGIYVPFIPIENLLFGIDMLWFCLITYSFFRNKSA